MSTKPNRAILHALEILLAELTLLRATGPTLKIIHRFRQVGSICAPGEEVFAIVLMHRGREHLVDLALAQRLLMNYLACHSHIPQSASQIAAGIRADSFYKVHGRNAISNSSMCRKISRSAVKVYVNRIREGLASACREAGLNIDPASVLLSEQTVSNEVGYRLKARIEWVHVDLDN